MRVFSTFTGIGGFEIGIQNAYRSTHAGGESGAQTNHASDGQGLQHAPGQDADTAQGSISAGVANRIDERPLFIGYSEIDKFAISVYENHFKGVKNYGDITKIDAETLPDFDCLVGGFPCQAFSIAGRRAGFNDTRGTLFFDLARILKAKKPRLFVFENVKGLLNHDGGRTFKTIISTIDELGYDAQWQLLNSKNHGVPQNRERIIIVGNLRGSSRPEVFPITGINANDISENSPVRIGTLRTHKDGNGFREMKSGVSPTIPARARADGSGQPVLYIPEATKKGYAEATPGDAINLNQINSKTRRGRVSPISPTLDTGMQIHTMLDNAQIRRLTPIECERLQAFPDNWTRYGISDNALVDRSGGYYTKESIWDYPVLKYIQKRVHHDNPVILISDTQRYKMAGNAVTTNVIQSVFEKIFESES